MIASSSKVTLADGKQFISFRTSSSPTSALITWEEEVKPEKEGDATIIIPRSMTVPVQYDGTFYSLTALIPTEAFFIKLDTEAVTKRFEGDWGEGVASKVVPLELYWGDSGSCLIPYCDLSVLQIRLFTQTMVPLEFVGNGKKGWTAYDPEVRNAYGGTTLVSAIGGLSFFMVKEKDGVNWYRLDQLPGGYYVEFFNIKQITTDTIVNATICRNELYDNVYGRMIDNP